MNQALPTDHLIIPKLAIEYLQCRSGIGIPEEFFPEGVF